MNTNNSTETTKAPLAPIILAILTGEEVSKSDFSRAAYTLVPTARDAGPKILTKEGIATARDIAGNEKVTPDQREANKRVVAAHETNLIIVVGSRKPALITILNTPVGAASEDHPELKEAYKELGVLSHRLLARKALPGLQRRAEDRSHILAGVASDVFEVIKDNPEFADLVEAATQRRNAAKARFLQLQADFDARFPDKAVLQLIRMIGLIADFQNDPDSVSPAEQRALVTRDGMPVFKNGRLTETAKDRLNAIQDDDTNPEWLAKQIRGIFARDGEAGRVNDVGSGL